jgi:DNA-binding XRE family transcriptional regulator
MLRGERPLFGTKSEEKAIELKFFVSFFVFSHDNWIILCIFASIIYQPIVKMDKDINRIKVVLVEKKRTNKWLAEQLGKDPATVSKWCTNACQPPMETYIKIAKLLDVELAELVKIEK